MKLKKIKIGPYLKAIPVVIGIGLAGFTGFASGAYADSYNANNKQILDLKSDIATLSSEGVVTPKEVEDVVTNASDAGRAVADLQNKYAGLTGDSDSIKANAAEIKKYFNDASSNAGAIWFSTGTWRFRTSYSLDGEILDCLWTCEDTDGNLLAYATAQYSGKDKVFSQFTKMVTRLGNSVVAATPSDPNEKTEAVKSTVDTIKEQIGDTSQDAQISEQDLAEINSAREQAREQHQGGN